MNVGVVIVCAGKGKRLGKVDKAVLRIKGKPLFFHTYYAFKEISEIKQIVLVLRKKHFELAKKLIKDKRVVLVEGGRKREDSVHNGLLSLEKKINYVLIHDGARPFVSRDIIKRVLKQLKKYPAVICALKAKDTLKKADKKKFVERTLNRDNIFLVQTPQGFKKSLILRAYKTKTKTDFFDDAQVLESIGRKVKIVEGDSSNIKITYPKDIILAKAMNERL
ncbi:MAG: 2-C-methyl-D-erythritol 4-phosphate cytidylyltransferase [Candidatus Omnitrophota bacterium]